MFRDTVVERANFYMTTSLPSKAVRFLRVSVGEAAVAKVERASNALFGQRNPIFQVFAIVLYLLGVGVFFVEAAPAIPNRYVGSWQWIPIVATLAVNIVSFTLACARDPGIVDGDNVDSACALFRPDQLLFFETTCRTCQQRKPARSKHCSACGHCIQMMDHHCMWLNNCVGLGNVRYFLVFLLSFAVVCIYGSFLFATTLLELRHTRGLVDVAVWDEDVGDMVRLSLKASILLLMDENVLLAIVTVLLVVLTPAILFFAAYQFRIGMLGYTSNEESKWLSVDDAVKDGVVFCIHNKGETTIAENSASASTYELIEKADQAADVRPKTLVTHLSQIKNQYDRGAWQNLLLLLSTPATTVRPKKAHVH
ncbi:palmitoyltransferase swf1 [Coemansia thaxteri]|uniref:Palmitoyltransferase n=2 Tax=Coemansia thaxteri TaxID=2663907 RepID=A0A9W8EIY8_9FUNG|nr:palmitoyltransferase swf1 [Coemansia thaxteri]KAJ2002341.1 palmitoyltransferase swf1 [Coemansia thaxteri]